VGVSGAGTANLTLTGTIAALNAFMAAEKVSFTSDASGADPVLTLTIDDGGASGGPAQTDQVEISISVADNRTGTNGKNVMIGLAEDSHIDGLGGNDTISGGGGNDTLLGSAGNDVLNGGIGDDSINGGADTDTASYDGAASGVTVDLSTSGPQNTIGAGLDTLLNIENLLGSGFADALIGDGSANTITGLTGADTISGGGGADDLIGGDGVDVIDGGGDNDVIYGRGEADVLTGGAGVDRFAFQLLSDSRKSDPDLITDLAAEDFVDVRAIDANTLKDGNQAFQLVGGFTIKAGQAVLTYDSGLDQTSLLLDVDADGKSDMTIVFDGDQREFTGLVL
jgi:Ca2+-binding RTX toxin-like protein